MLCWWEARSGPAMELKGLLCEGLGVLAQHRKIGEVENLPKCRAAVETKRLMEVGVGCKKHSFLPYFFHEGHMWQPGPKFSHGTHIGLGKGSELG